MRDTYLPSQVKILRSSTYLLYFVFAEKNRIYYYRHIKTYSDKKTNAGLVRERNNRAGPGWSAGGAAVRQPGPARRGHDRRQGRLLAGPLPPGPRVHRPRREGWLRYQPEGEERYVSPKNLYMRNKVLKDLSTEVIGMRKKVGHRDAFALKKK